MRCAFPSYNAGQPKTDFSFSFFSPNANHTYDTEEWERARNLLFSQDHEDRSNGVDLITLWLSRGRCPVAAEVTSLLVKVMLNVECGSRDDLELRMMASMALIRFVNGITDAQQQRKFARPVHEVAAQLGMPDVCVSLRHAATHGHLPCLSALCLACKLALRWLHDAYWSSQESHLQQVKEDVLRVLCAYQENVEGDSADAASHSGKKKKRRKRNPASKASGWRKRAVAMVKEMVPLLESSELEDTLFHALLDCGLLVPTPKPIPQNMPDILDVVESTFKSLRDVWSPVLQVASNTWPEFTCAFVSAGLSRFDTYQALLNEGIEGVGMEGWNWVHHSGHLLSRWLLFVVDASRSHCRPLDSPQRVAILERCMLKPTLWNAPLATELLSQASLHKEPLRVIHHLLRCPLPSRAPLLGGDLSSISSGAPIKSTSMHSPLTPAQAHAAAQDVRASARGTARLDGDNPCGWESCPDFPWSCPPGLLPGQASMPALVKPMAFAQVVPSSKDAEDEYATFEGTQSPSHWDGEEDIQNHLEDDGDDGGGDGESQAYDDELRVEETKALESELASMYAL